jgi:membrane protein YdbS with pleckstrin-like domain
MSQIILIVAVHALVFGVACYFIGADREIGPVASGFLGLILGVVGLVIVLISSRRQVIPFDIQLRHYKQLLDNGTISEAEYNHLKGRLIEQQ